MTEIRIANNIKSDKKSKTRITIKPLSTKLVIKINGKEIKNPARKNGNWTYADAARLEAKLALVRKAYQAAQIQKMVRREAANNQNESIGGLIPKDRDTLIKSIALMIEKKELPKTLICYECNRLAGFIGDDQFIARDEDEERMVKEGAVMCKQCDSVVSIAELKYKNGLDVEGRVQFD